jgi:uncharacterized protein with GYD domain
MPKYLLQASYTADGTKGLLKDGGSKRKAMVEEMTKAAGGKIEAFYFAFGDSDVYIIVDAPNQATVAAISMAVNASGAVTLKTTVLLTPQEVDQASKKVVKYRSPGKR